MENYATKEEMKAEALRRLNELKIYKPYINAFKAKKQTVTMFEGPGIGYYATKDNGFEELENKIKEVEERYDCIVYAVVHYFIEDMEIYSLLIVTKYKDDWDYEYQNCEIYSTAYSYVWNKSVPEFSELGDIAVQSVFGGIRYVS